MGRDGISGDSSEIWGEKKKNISEKRGNYSGQKKNKSQPGTKIENIQQTGLSPAVESRSSYFLSGLSGAAEADDL